MDSSRAGATFRLLPVLLELWSESLERVKDTELKARIQGVAAQMMKFYDFFGVSLGLLILRHTDNLSRMLQKADMSATEGQVIAAMTVSTLRSSRNDASFDLFWQNITASAENLQIDHPVLPRCRKTPRRFSDGTAPIFHVTVQYYFREIYFVALDLAISAIEDCFNQPGYQTYANVQALLPKVAGMQPYQGELQFVLDFYGTDFDSLLLPAHLEIFSNSFPGEGKIVLSDILKFFRICTPGQLELMSQVSKLVRQVLVMPATAESEKSFSAVRRIKTYLRLTMSQQSESFNAFTHPQEPHR